MKMEHEVVKLVLSEHDDFDIYRLIFKERRKLQSSWNC